MKIKYFSLILIIFMMCGCSAEVNLEISDNNIDESVDITFYQNAVYSKDIIKSSFRNYIPIYASDVIVDAEIDQPFPDIKYYEKTETDLGNGYLFNYRYNFDINEYEEARTVKDGFRNYNISVNDSNHTISITTDNNGLLYFDDYPLLEEVRVNIKTDYFVEENNADSVDGNIYTWVFNRDSNKSIDMLINTENNVSNGYNLNIIDNLTPIVFVIVVVLVILLLLILKIETIINYN